MSAYSGTPPLSYVTPSFPSLYWPIKPSPGEARFLYYITDVWRFTLFWTFITTVGAHLIVALWAVTMQYAAAWQRKRYLNSEVGKSLTAKNRKLFGENPIAETFGWVWLVPMVYLTIGGIEALMAGSLVGLVLGAVYSAGYFKMSTWTPLIWGVINMLILVVSSFRVQGGL